MLPSVYKLLKHPAITAIVANKIGSFGEIPQDTWPPYIVYHLISHTPHTSLDAAPVSDAYQIQIDCWHNEQKAGHNLFLAVQSVLDAARIYNRLILMEREIDTRLYRFSIQADIIHHRP